MSFENQDQYIIRNKIGEGGMGVVYLAQDTSLERLVAIKELTRPAVPGQDATESRFQQEALALARLNHPNITHLYAFLPKGDTYWMVMEYVPGKTLEEWLHYRGRMNAALACSIVIQMLEGLHHAHRKGIIHRDLKPANVMISEEGEVKIMDFGIARIRDSQRITRHGKSVGTLAYMAPEQIKGEEGDERTDIYAAGNILYELLSGQTPFEAETDYHLMKLKLEEAPRPLINLAASTPPELQRVVFRALDRNPARRFESVTALKEAIEHSMHGKLLKAEVLNPMLSDLQQEESFVQAVKENPLQKFSSMVKAMPVKAAADRISGGFRQLSRTKYSKAWLLLAASVVLCAILLIWNSGSDTAAADEPVTTNAEAIPSTDVPEIDDTISNPRQSAIIENEIVQNSLSNGYSAPKETPKKKDNTGNNDGSSSKKKAGENESRDRYNEGATDGQPAGKSPSSSTGPVTIPSGMKVRVVLDETLSSESVDRDGSRVQLHCDENVVVNGRTVIRKGAQVIGKVVDVRSSSNSKKEAIIGFIIQNVQAVDGTMLKLRSDRFRNQADATGKAVYYNRGQSFSAELKGGKLD